MRNPANGREVVVRINDRGPFHGGRIIDLSYTAALKLGVLRGVAPVELERITFDDIRTGADRGPRADDRVIEAGCGPGAVGTPCGTDPPGATRVGDTVCAGVTGISVRASPRRPSSVWPATSTR